jgi:Fic family protein
MVSIVTKRIKGNEYIYLVTSVRKKGRVIQKTVKYIGKKRPVTKEEFECMKISYQEEDWILNDFNDELSYQHHEKMKKASNSYKEYLKGLDEITKEKEREKFLSIFIANSNAIEGSTMTARDTFNYLFNDTVPKGHTKKELHMASNMMNAWNYVEENQKKFPKHEELFKLHEFVNRNIESEKTLGKYKKSQNYVGNIYTTSHLFAEERMNSLLRWISNAFRKINDFEVAFQSHAQFEIIHPFVDGNGRVGRLLLNWLIMRKNHMPLAIPVKKRDDYISALNVSRAGKVEAICKFCFKEYIGQYRFM